MWSGQWLQLLRSHVRNPNPLFEQRVETHVSDSSDVHRQILYPVVPSRPYHHIQYNIYKLIFNKLILCFDKSIYISSVPNLVFEVTNISIN